MEDAPFTILVVDDNDTVRQMLSLQLEQAGYRVRAVDDGLRALKLVEEEPFDLVLLDVMMPVLTGFDVLTALRRSASGRELPVIMATARDDTSDVVKAFELGADDYVTKPLDFPVVRARVRAQLRGRIPAAVRPRQDVQVPHEIVPGMVLQERFQLEEELGRGRYGMVFRARDRQLERPVALKLLHTGFAFDDNALLRFQQEGMTACRLQHPNAVAVLDFSVTDRGLPYLVMELLEGHTLATELARAGRLPIESCASIARPLADVLAEAERAGLVHRDIKPQNIFLHQSPTDQVVKVVDFGLAKVIGDEAVRQKMTLDDASGTPAYMAPERFSGESYDSRVDVYSFGVVLFELLTGRLPFDASSADPVALAIQHLETPPPSPRAIVPEIPAAVSAAVTAALTKDPSARPTAADLKTTLAVAFDEARGESRYPVG